MRGIVNSPTKLALKRLILSNKPQFIFIAKLLMDAGLFPQIWLRSLNLKIVAMNDSINAILNLSCLCDKSLDPTFLDRDD